MFSYNALLWTAQEYRLPVQSVVFLLERPPDGFLTQVVSRYGSHSIQQFTFRAVHLYSMDATQLAQTPGLAPLAPLGQNFSAITVQMAAQTVLHSQQSNSTNQLAVLYLLGRIKGLTEGVLERILSLEVVRMSDVYEEITEAGRREGVLRVLARQMARKFPADIGKLDALLGRCTTEDLEWLAEEIVVVKQFSALRRQLEARLAGR
jgi:hypothetical protein